MNPASLSRRAAKGSFGLTSPGPVDLAHRIRPLLPLGEAGRACGRQNALATHPPPRRRLNLQSICVLCACHIGHLYCRVAPAESVYLVYSVIFQYSTRICSHGCVSNVLPVSRDVKVAMLASCSRRKARCRAYWRGLPQQYIKAGVCPALEHFISEEQHSQTLHSSSKPFK